MKGRVGIYINNRTTSFLCSKFIHEGVHIDFEPVFLYPSESFRNEVNGHNFDCFSSKIIGCDYPWRNRKKFGSWTYFYALSFNKLRSKDIFSDLSGLVVFKDDGTLDRILVLLAKAKGLKTICIQEEAIYEFPDSRSLKTRPVWFERFVQRLVHPDLPLQTESEKGLLADFNIVYGEKKAERLVSKGYPRNQIFSLGNPIYDNCLKKNPPEAADRSIILVHQQTFDHLDNEFDWYEAAAEASKEVGASLTIKLHPRSKRNETDFERLKRSDGPKFTILTSGDVQGDELKYGLFITGDSGAVNRALADGVVPILLNGANPKGRYLDLAQRGAALEALTPSDLKKLIIRFFSEPNIRAVCLSNRDTVLAAHLGPLDGMAGQRYRSRIAHCVNG